MTYIVSSGALNSTHSLTHPWAVVGHGPEIGPQVGVAWGT